MGIEPLTDAQLGLPGGGPAPLWYDVLREARRLAPGKHLGPVGGRIVAEVMIGLMEKDPSAFLRNAPGWTPFLPSAETKQLTMPDLITFADHGLGITRLPGG